jgi:hypothetical protein
MCDDSVEFQDGDLVQIAGDIVVWQMLGGVRWGIPSGSLLKELAPGQQVIHISDAVARTLPVVPPEGTVIDEYPSGRQYLIVRGIRFWVSPWHHRRLGLAYRRPIRVHEALASSVRDGGRYRWGLQGPSRFVIAPVYWLGHKYQADWRGVALGIIASALYSLIHGG